ncbi:glycoside hydrolase family 10 protein [Pelomonas sp. KK5]|uniref:glycoside hydrolase family 10 protein n=1 Tax=Pelomonas sp. KK5 TaxID=1855730 RepID=UPI00097C2955|nr:family 10 glycosylhydrolase [Pelomonas sp. KK5]
MLITRRSILGSALALGACANRPAGPRLQAAPELAALPPAAPREFRAAWVATVANIDWPSKKGLSTAEQQAEMHAMLDQAVALGLNAIIFQVRTAADALYDSPLEPWSEYLSGTQGQAPSPYYDPLALWIAEAHKRGLELHAWFNPFRARQSTARSAPAATHISQTHPAWVKSYGDQLWIDPGEPDAGEHSLSVFRDVLQRYDVDGIHIDDYFYPYAVNGPDGKTELDFPDEPSWQRYVSSGGTLARADWRRQNVSRLVERIHDTLRATKPWVRFGVSPFGLGKPALRPAGISGYSQYDKLYADVELWLERGWLDYLAPQLYWPRTQKAQAFGPLLQYWHAQNPLGRHIWPGMFTSRISADANDAKSWAVDEITGQIQLQREIAPQTGHIHFSMVALTQNRRRLADALKAGAYAQPALVPATPWLAAEGSALPQATLYLGSPDGAGMLALHVGGSPVLQHAVWLRYGERWEFRTGTELKIPAAGLNAIVASAIDRVGREGPRSAWKLS